MSTTTPTPSAEATPPRPIPSRLPRPWPSALAAVAVRCSAPPAWWPCPEEPSRSPPAAPTRRPPARAQRRPRPSRRPRSPRCPRRRVSPRASHRRRRPAARPLRPRAPRSPSPRSPSAAGVVVDEKYVVTQPTEGRVQGLQRHLHPPGLPGRLGRGRPDHLPVPHEPLRHHLRRPRQRAGSGAASGGEAHQVRRQRLRHRLNRLDPPPTQVLAGGSRLVCSTCQPVSPIVRRPGRSRSSRASTGSRTRPAG